MAANSNPPDSWTDTLLRLFDEVAKGKSLPTGSLYGFDAFPQVATTTVYGFSLLGFANNAVIQQHLLLSDRLPYEPFLTFLNLMMSRAGGMYLDIGANIGYFSLLTAYGAAAPVEIHAFEPNTVNFRFLRENIRRNGREAEIQPYPIGLGDSDGFADLSKYGTGASFVRGWDEGKGDVEGVESVIVKPLDTVFKPEHLAYPTVVKIDVEGFEAAVLRGGADVLSHDNVACVLCEINQQPHPDGQNRHAGEAISLLESYGYECLGVKGSAVAADDPTNGELAPASEFTADSPGDWPTSWVCLRPTCEMYELIMGVVPLFGAFTEFYPMPVDTLRQAIADLV
jgi:FkbM family methyltransferase